MPDTPEMVEQVAKALAHANQDSDWHSWLDDARTAIEAMREPTAAMLNGPLPPHSSISGIRYESRRDLRPIIYQAMIDAALAAPDERERL